MRKLLSCEFNLDTAYVELKFADGMKITENEKYTL